MDAESFYFMSLKLHFETTDCWDKLPQTINDYGRVVVFFPSFILTVNLLCIGNNEGSITRNISLSLFYPL